RSATTPTERTYRPHERSRLATSAAAALAATSLLAAPALAEGSFTSSLSSWMVGKDTRTWFDNDHDSASTNITMGGCRTTNGASPGRMQFKLIKHRTALPGKAIATNTMSCSSSNVTTRYGAQDRSYYHINFAGVVDGPTRYYSASTFKVSY
ncbi:hypothetical protein, partial [Brachybacterium tyrofermentans]|uniref:hypothetical protein n=1 Tax=Brachybacterium tyrofermentans TaxID=47848 RepID=UPI001D019FB8